MLSFSPTRLTLPKHKSYHMAHPSLHGFPPPNKGSANFLIKYDPHQIPTLPPIISCPLLLTLFPLLFIAWSQVSPRYKFALIYFSQSKSQSSKILKKRRVPHYECGERTFQVGNVTEVKPWGWEGEGFYSVFSLVRCNCRRKGAIGSHSAEFCQLMCSNSKLEEETKRITFSLLSVGTNLKSDSSLRHSSPSNAFD